MKKNIRNIPNNILKLLLAKSGNQCAFPNCSHPIFDNDNIFVAQLCHIEAVSPLGQRYNKETNGEKINSFNNLLFLCYRHHKVTDNVELYTIEKMREIKAKHEAKYNEETYQYPKEVLNTLKKEIENYWDQIKRLHSEHVFPELAVPINTQNDILLIIATIQKHLKIITKVNSNLMNNSNGHFEYICISIPNFLLQIKTEIDQLEIKYLEEQVIKEPKDSELLTKLKTARKKFEKIAKTALIAD